MRRDPALIGLLVVFVLVCALWGASTIVHLDAVPLVLALEHQDLRLHQPQPPGYILHVWLAEIVHALTSRPVLSLRAVSLLLLAGSAIFLYRLALVVADRATARLAVLLFVTSPLVLFHGMTAGPYAGEALAGTLCAYSLARAWRRQQRELRFESYLVGLLAGLRPTTVVATVPLLVWTGRMLALPRRSWVLALVAGSLGTLCWLLPQADIAGGLDDYVPLVWAVAKPAMQEGALLGGPVALWQQVALLAATLFWGGGGVRWLATLGTMLWRRRRRPAAAASEPVAAALTASTPAPAVPTVATAPAGVAALASSVSPAAPTPQALPSAFVAAWLLPPGLAVLLFGMPATGYALTFASPLCLWLALAMHPAGRRQAGAQGTRRRAVVAAVVALDVAIYLFVPTPAARIERGPRRAVRGDTLPCERSLRRWDSLPVQVQSAAAWFLGPVDFFFAHTRCADFEPLRVALQDLGPLAPQTLVLGGAMTRAACVLAPARDVVHFDALRPAPFLHYREQRPTVVASPYVVPQEIVWLLVEGSTQQIVPSAFTQSGELAESLQKPSTIAADFHLMPLGAGAIDVWYVPAAGDGTQRLHLVRAAPPADPRLYERAGRATSACLALQSIAPAR